MRRLLAVLALVVTTWSNLAAFPCGSPTRAVADAHPADVHPHTGHGADHGPGHGAPTTQQGTQGAGSDLSPECGILMACGALSRGPTATGTQAIVPPRHEDAPHAALHEPSAADLTQEPPPPRRLA
jgi:hypothetical protein